MTQPGKSVGSGSCLLLTDSDLVIVVGGSGGGKEVGVGTVGGNGAAGLRNSASSSVERKTRNIILSRAG